MFQDIQYLSAILPALRRVRLVQNHKKRTPRYIFSGTVFATKKPCQKFWGQRRIFRNRHFFEQSFSFFGISCVPILAHIPVPRLNRQFRPEAHLPQRTIQGTQPATASTISLCGSITGSCAARKFTRKTFRAIRLQKCDICSEIHSLRIGFWQNCQFFV